MTTTAKQVRLIPEEQPDLNFSMLKLDTLPSDEELEGLEPSKALIQNIQSVGVTSPVLLRLMQVKGRGPGPLKVVDGRRRIKAARRVGLTHIPAIWINDNQLGTLSAAAMTVASNATRSDNLASDLNAIKEMQKAGASETEMASATGLTLTQLRTKLALTVSLDSRLQKALQEGRISQNLAVDASRLSGRQQGELVKLLAERPLTRKDVKELRNVNVQQAQASLSDVLAGAIDYPDDGGSRSRRARATALLDQLEDGLGADIPTEVQSALAALQLSLSFLQDE